MRTKDGEGFFFFFFLKQFIVKAIKAREGHLWGAIIKEESRVVWPEKNRQMSIKVAQNWFH